MCLWVALEAERRACPLCCFAPYFTLLLLSLSVQAAWAEELKVKANGGQPSLLRALRKAFGLEVFIAGIWKTIWSVFVLVGERRAWRLGSKAACKPAGSASCHAPAAAIRRQLRGQEPAKGLATGTWGWSSANDGG